MKEISSSLLIVFRHYREDLYSQRSRDPNKVRPHWYSNLLCMKSLIRSIRNNYCKNSSIKLLLWYDGTQVDFDTDDLINFLKYNTQGIDVSYFLKDYLGENKSEVKSFPEILNYVANYMKFDYIYLLENDYLHREESIASIFEIFETHADIEYLNLADHVDYYHLPIHKNYGIDLRYTDNYILKSSFSTTATFVTRYLTFMNDYNLLTQPDYQFFSKVVGIKGRLLYTVVPGLAGHCMNNLLPPAVNWDAIAAEVLTDFPS